jgi:hypothetical protein
MNPAEIPVRLSHLWRCQGDAAVVVSDAHFNLVRLVLNPVGSKVWTLMDGERSVGEIASALSVEYPQVPLIDLTESVSYFLDQLREEWLMMTREELVTYD